MDREGMQVVNRTLSVRDRSVVHFPNLLIFWGCGDVVFSGYTFNARYINVGVQSIIW